MEGMGSRGLLLRNGEGKGRESGNDGMKKKEGEWREKEREEPALPIKKSFPRPCM